MARSYSYGVIPGNKGTGKPIVSVKLQGTELVMGRLKKLGVETRLACVDVLKEHLSKVYALAYDLCAKDSYDTADTLYYSYDTQNVTGIVASRSKQALFLEFGTGPHYPPPGALEEWMIRHGMDPEEEDALIFYIGQHGTPAQPFMFPAWEAERPQFLARMRRRVTTAIARSASKR